MGYLTQKLSCQAFKQFKDSVFSTRSFVLRSPYSIIVELITDLVGLQEVSTYQVITFEGVQPEVSQQLLIRVRRQRKAKASIPSKTYH